MGERSVSRVTTQSHGGVNPMNHTSRHKTDLNIFYTELNVITFDKIGGADYSKEF